MKASDFKWKTIIITEIDSNNFFSKDWESTLKLYMIKIYQLITEGKTDGWNDVEINGNISRSIRYWTDEQSARDWIEWIKNNTLSNTSNEYQLALLPD